MRGSALLLLILPNKYCDVTLTGKLTTTLLMEKEKSFEQKYRAAIVAHSMLLALYYNDPAAARRDDEFYDRCLEKLRWGLDPEEDMLEYLATRKIRM